MRPAAVWSSGATHCRLSVLSELSSAVTHAEACLSPRLIATLLSSLPAPAAQKTKTVVLIVSDGLRWQEVFTGADPLLLDPKNGGNWMEEADAAEE